MAIALAKQYQGKVDEAFIYASMTESGVNQNYSWEGAKTISLQRVSTATMNDYQRTGSNRYGTPEDLNVLDDEYTLTQDRSFTFVIDKMDEDETKGALEAASALARQVREKIIPEVDGYRLQTMVNNAGGAATPGVLSETTVYDAILDGTLFLDDNEVPTEGRKLYVSNETYKYMKQSSDIVMETEIGMKARIRGVISNLDGMEVIKVPAGRLPANMNFLITHPVATTAPIKLQDYTIHENAPGYNGSLVEGRIYYDAFVLENKKNAIYKHMSV